MMHDEGGLKNNNLNYKKNFEPNLFLEKLMTEKTVDLLLKTLIETMEKQLNVFYLS